MHASFNLLLMLDKIKIFPMPFPHFAFPICKTQNQTQQYCQNDIKIEAQKYGYLIYVC